MSITTTGVEGIDEPLAAPAEPVAQIDPYPLASAARSNEPPWASPRVAWFTISMVGLVTMFGQMDRAIFYLLVSSIKRDLHLTDTHISLLMGAAYSAAYFCVGLPMARLTDVGKRKFILPGALALWSLGTFLCAMSSGFISFFAARSIVGAGESVKGPGSVSIISDVLPRDKLSRGFALYNLSIRGGEAIAQILGGLLIGLFATTVIVLPFLGELHGWHLVFMIFGLPGVLFAILFMITVPEPARHGRRSSASMPLREVAHFLAPGLLRTHLRMDARPVRADPRHCGAHHHADRLVRRRVAVRATGAQGVCRCQYAAGRLGADCRTADRHHQPAHAQLSAGHGLQPAQHLPGDGKRTEPTCGDAGGDAQRTARPGQRALPLHAQRDRAGPRPDRDRADDRQSV
jgi:hypothetical protein